MKKIFTLFFFLLAGLVYVHGQSISPQVLGAEGGFGTFGTTTLSSTSGEPATATLVNGTTEITQGFQQPYYDCTYPAGPITGVASVCPNDQGVAYSVAAIVGASGYNWTLPAGGTIASGSNTNVITVNYDPITSSSGNVTVAGTNTCGSGRSSSFAVTVKTSPPVAVTPATAVCTGKTTATLVASGATGYTWAPASNLTPTNATGVTETAEVSELTFYTVTGTGGNGCTASVIVPVATVPTGGTITPVSSIICSGGTKTLTVSGAAGNDYQWQKSTDNSTWTDITGATNTTYTTATGDGNTNKFYRLLANSSCWDVASTTSEVDVSTPTIVVTASSITDNTLILNWSPAGTGNYNITYSGATSGLLTGVTPPKTITGLTASGSYTIVVTQTGLTGCPASGTVSTGTLCAVPTNLTATPLTVGVTQELNVSWNGPAGNYRVYYRPLYSAVTFYTKDVTNATSVVLTKQGNNNLYGSNTYQIYVSRLDCPNTGNIGQPTSSIYVTTNPTTVAGCASPVIDTVFSTCPVLLEVQLHGGSGSYNVYIQRLTPTLQAVNSYGITGGDFVINAAAGQQYLISADSRCGSTVSTLNIWHNTLTVKPICSSPSNLVLSNPTCHGFTASWNADQCISNTISGYDFYMRVAGSINFNSYAVPLPVAPVGPHLIVTISGPGKNIQAFVQSVYSCGGAVTYGPSSQTVTIITASAGCKDEETTEQPGENKPAVQQYSADNDEVFSLYPNPNTGEFNVDLSRLSNNTDEVRIEVLNMIGQTVITQITSISDGHMSQVINLPNGTAAGTYIVRLTAGKNIYTAKINVSK